MAFSTFLLCLFFLVLAITARAAPTHHDYHHGVKHSIHIHHLPPPRPQAHQAMAVSRELGNWPAEIQKRSTATIKDREMVERLELGWNTEASGFVDDTVVG
ncbi:hypothetical protein S40285_09873 [Stachybotrys chlorohalonatus IBT 40285]|uniref:Uncharacterized protein n=1 Tax=Stachybotrys chlorohalonatus (strain IBT 40285) TaxID=1283841 RepID=A0A084QJT9_STAC4|nr:hypothetical protein S40285_09873 [Stachybotrys chlorohalonata IBT 40285]